MVKRPGIWSHCFWEEIAERETSTCALYVIRLGSWVFSFSLLLQLSVALVGLARCSQGNMQNSQVSSLTARCWWSWIRTQVWHPSLSSFYPQTSKHLKNRTPYNLDFKTKMKKKKRFRNLSRSCVGWIIELTVLIKNLPNCWLPSYIRLFGLVLS